MRKRPQPGSGGAASERRSRLGGWFSWVLLLSIVVAVTATTEGLHQHANSRRKAQLALAGLAQQLGQQSSLEAQAMGDPYRATPLTVQSQELDEQIGRAIDRLASAGVPATSVGSIRTAVRSYQEALNAEYRQLRSGDWRAAWSYDHSVTRPRYEALTAVIDREATRLGRVAEQSQRRARLGSLLAMLLGALMCGFIAWQRDRSRRAMVRQAALRRGEDRFRALVHNASDVIMITDAAGMVTYVTASVERILGRKAGELVGTSILDYAHPDDRAVVATFLERLGGQVGLGEASEWRVQRGDGTWCHVECLSNNLLADPDIGGLVLTLRDVSERRALEARLSHQAFHDGLTGLANRALFHNRVEHALSAPRPEGRFVAVLFCDLDGFKTVNDSLGHAAGDELLVAVATRLQACLRQGDTLARLADEHGTVAATDEQGTVARLGGDEFAILLEGAAEDATSVAVSIADRILQAVSRPVEIRGRKVSLGVSIGIAAAEGRSDADKLLRDADAAMYIAKAQGKSRHVVFAPTMHAEALQRLELHNDLRHALDQEQLAIVYQPLINLVSGAIEGAEALLRWHHPTRGLISPVEFIPAAEETGLIVPIGSWVLRQACQQLAAWQRQHPTAADGIGVTVNVSALQLKEPDLVDNVLAALADAGLAAGRLTLELTESCLLTDEPHVAETLSALRRAGVHLAIDDFGTGWSSLAYLRQLPVDILKIDKAFIDDVTRSRRHAEFVRGILVLAGTLGMGTVAEGIEQAEQAAALSALGFEHGQGFHFAPPLHPDELGLLIAVRSTWISASDRPPGGGEALATVGQRRAPTRARTLEGPPPDGGPVNPRSR